MIKHGEFLWDTVFTEDLYTDIGKILDEIAFGNQVRIHIRTWEAGE